MARVVVKCAAGVVVALLSVSVLGSQNASGTRAITLRFPAQVDLTNLSIDYFLQGSFGGYGGFVRTQPDVREYKVDTWYEGHPATSFKAFVMCPGYRIVLLTESGLTERTASPISITLEPLGWTAMAGRIVALPTPERFEVVANYVARWSHRVFGLADGIVPTIRLATSKVGPDGSFALRMPDLTNDPFVMSFTGTERSSRGKVFLTAREIETLNLRYQLELQHQPGQAVEFEVASRYPQDLQLVATPR